MLVGKWLSSPGYFTCSHFFATLEWASHPLLISSLLCYSLLEMILELELFISALFPRHQDWHFYSPAENHHCRSPADVGSEFWPDVFLSFSCRCFQMCIAFVLPSVRLAGTTQQCRYQSFDPDSTFHSFSLWANCRPAFSRFATQLAKRLSVWPPSITSAGRAWTQTLSRCLQKDFVWASNVRKPSVGQMQVRLGY